MKSLLLSGLILMALAQCAGAHQMRVPSVQSGIAINAVTHGEMAILAGYRKDIIRIADGAPVTDPRFRVLLNYTNIEHAICLFGMVPGTVGDEESPFNECAHADLAAAKELLLHMRQMPVIGSAANDLTAEIDMAVTASGGALIKCQFSAETYNSAEFIMPHWERVATHLPSLATLLALSFVVGAPFLVSRSSARKATDQEA